MDPLGFLLDLADGLLTFTVAPDRRDGFGCLFWMVVLVLLAVGIGAILYSLA